MFSKYKMSKISNSTSMYHYYFMFKGKGRRLILIIIYLKQLSLHAVNCIAYSSL